jgi:3-oxoacyl-[acyl-carrier-protein] synthase II
VIRALISDFTFISPLGGNERDFCEKLFSGTSGIREIDGQFGPGFPIRAVGLIEELKGNFNPIPAAKNLLQKLLSRTSTKRKIDGVVFFIPPEDELSTITERLRSVDGQIDFLKNIIEEETGQLISQENFLSLNEACVTGISSLSLAAQRIRAGIWDRVLVLGVDLRCSPLDLLRMHSLGALSTRATPASMASCPFSKERDGFVKAQGGAAFLLENSGSCQNAPWGEIVGYGQSADAFRLTDGRPDGKVAAKAILRAMSMAGMSADGIDCISAHATSTRLGDALEARVIRSIWKESAEMVPVTALKSQLGHAAQAAGLLQVVAGLFMLCRQEISPTINLNLLDPLCDLNHISNCSRAAKLTTILCNSHAFGGQNAALILRGIDR